MEMSEDKNCHVVALDKPLDRDALSEAVAAYLSVGGMGCPNCAMRVRNGLLSLEGVFVAEVYLEQGIAAAAYDPGRVKPGDLVQAVALSGNDGRHHYWAQFIQQVPVSRLLG
jgi:copper chaperone CopZ